MRIGMIAPLAEAIPPPLYGGTERVVHVLTEELVRRGHDVTLFASGDSRTSARLVPCSRAALRLDPLAVDGVAPVVTMLARVAELADRFDVVHNHADYLAFPFARHWQPPTLTTLHGRLDLPELPALYERFPEVYLVSISESQRRPLAHLGLRWVGTVPNGVQVERLTFRAMGGDYLVFLGRISPEKRPDLAVEVARRTGLPLKIAAKVDEVDRAWHEEHIAPLLDDPLVEYVGEVDEAGKDALLGGAAALLFPSRWPEPFGLVMIEAMACGTPVVALRYGAVPEVVSDGETGFVCDSIDEMVAAVGRLGELDRAACRRRVETHFSARAMTDGYEQAYAALLNDARPLPIPNGALIAGRPVAHGRGALEGDVG